MTLNIKKYAGEHTGSQPATPPIAQQVWSRYEVDTERIQNAITTDRE